MSEWQLIATAPKDGSDILVCGGTYYIDVNADQGSFPLRRPRIAYWDANMGGVWKSGYATGYNDAEWVCIPTHWMPVPEPPVTP